MEFQSAVHEAIYEKISEYMKELYGESVTGRTDFPAFYLKAGSATVHIGVFAWGDDAIVIVRSYVVTGAEKTPEMMEFLLRENYEMRFGAFSMDEEGDIGFEHTIVGSTCDATELKASILTVANIADRYDDQIVSRWGGRRALERA
jgi:hypothetical protein